MVAALTCPRSYHGMAMDSSSDRLMRKTGLAAALPALLVELGHMSISFSVSVVVNSSSPNHFPCSWGAKVARLAVQS
jgi:hypothetical protein